MDAFGAQSALDDRLDQLVEYVHGDFTPVMPAAQFAIDRFLRAQQNVSEQMSELYQSIRDGSATDEDRKRLKSLREQFIALSKEVEDVMGRLLVGKHLHHT